MTAIIIALHQFVISLIIFVAVALLLIVTYYCTYRYCYYYLMEPANEALETMEMNVPNR